MLKYLRFVFYTRLRFENTRARILTSTSSAAQNIQYIQCIERFQSTSGD